MTAISDKFVSKIRPLILKTPNSFSLSHLVGDAGSSVSRQLSVRNVGATAPTFNDLT